MTRTLRTLIGALTAATLAASGAAADERYGYVRTLEGSATISARDAERQAAEMNQPLMAGDRIEVGGRSRIELELSDRNLARLDGGSELIIETSAFSGDTSARSTRLRLEVGDLQLVVTEEALGDDLPRVDTPNATIYVTEPGLYRISTDGGDFTEATVRSGRLEVRSPTDAIELESGDSVRVSGGEWPRLDRLSARAEDDFDLWGRELDGEVAQADLRYVEPEMRYTTASLRRHGGWVNVESRWAWHPYGVSSSWRPYQDGRWVYTPSGLTWVSNEPWGWSTYHYGSWDQVPGYGWVWFPGSVYSPAWVYWYWGPSHVGWCPSGYYSRHYRRSGFDGFRYGVYGWAGGGWGGFLDWSFVPTRYFGHRDQRRHCRSGYDFRDRYGLHDVPRGIITTDTRRITPDRWDRPEEVIDVLRRTPRDTRPGGRIEGELPDVSDFIRRRNDLDPELRNRLAEMPLPTDRAEARPRARRDGEGPGEGGRSVIAVPRSSGPVTGEQPRTATPRVGRPRIESPVEDGSRHERSQPNPAGPRVVTPRGEHPVPATPAWRSERPQSPRSNRPSTVQPRSGDQPTDADRRGWRDGTTTPRSSAAPRRTEAGPRVGRPTSEAPTGVYAPRERRVPEGRPTERPAYREPSERPSDTPPVRRVIDGVRNSGRGTYERPASRPSARPETSAPRYSTPSRPTRPETSAPRSYSAPSRPTARPSEVRESPSSQRGSERSRGEARGNDRPREDKKPPKRDDGGG